MTDATSGRVPVLEVVTTSWRFLATHWREFVPAAALVGLVSAVANSFAVTPANLGVSLFVLIVQTTVSVMYSASVYRRVVRDERTGYLGLTLSADEGRLLGVAVSLMLLFMPLAVLLFGVVLLVVLPRLQVSPAEFEALLQDSDAFADALAAALGPTGSLAFSLFIVLVAAITIYIGVRLIMVSPASLGERRIVVFQTWSWSHGNILPILGAICLTMGPGILALMLVGGMIVSAFAAIAPGAGFVGAAIVGMLGALLNVPVLALGASLYKGLRPSDFPSK